MRRVTQSKLYAGPGIRGSCVQACIATVFGIEETMVPERGHDIGGWTSLHYPGLQYVRWECEPTRTPPTPLGHRGFWIATVHTTTAGFTDDCGRCWEFEGNENGPPLCDPPRPCPFCGEQFGQPKGTRPGYHAIVMHGAKVDHDPNPNADWDIERVYVGAAWWIAADPSRIEPRRLPVVVADAALAAAAGDSGEPGE